MNVGRHLAAQTFAATLAEHYGRPGVTELAFRDSWLARLGEVDALTANGWYEPPPFGVAVLFASDDDPRRMCFESLRLPEFAPRPTRMSWDSGLLFAYCSPVHRPTGLAGDFGVTLYFGKKAEVRSHFRRAFAATAELLAELGPLTSSAALLRRSEILFREHGLKNTISSITDSVPLDLGHSMPSMRSAKLATSRSLCADDRRFLGDQRRFVSTSADWLLAEEAQVTIEPQLIAPDRSDLPQVSLHYVVAVGPTHVRVARECDDLLRQFGLAD
jgi:hypothetical protein